VTLIVRKERRRMPAPGEFPTRACACILRCSTSRRARRKVAAQAQSVIDLRSHG
jgi:hypothetical protein